MASPFKRKPALVRTYGSSSSSSHTAAAAQPRPSARQPSALDRLLADSSDEERSSDEPRHAQTPKRAATAAAAAKGKEPVRSRRSTSAAAPSDKDQSRWDENHATRTRETRRSTSRGTTSVDPTRSQAKSSGSQLPQRTSPRKRAAHTPVDHEQQGEDSAEDEILSRPSPPRRKVKRTDSSNPPAGSRPALTRTGPGKPVDDDDDDDDNDEIPAPTTFVPLAKRLKQAPQVSHDGSNTTQPRAEERTPPPPPPKRPRPRKAATAPTPTPALSSPRPPADGDDKDQTSHPSAPAPASPAKSTPGAAVRRSAAASPVKDLSAVFSRFATRTSVPPSAPIATGGSSSSVVDEQHVPSLLDDADSRTRSPVGGRPTVGLKRARSLVGGMAGPIAKRLGGGTRSPKPEADDPDEDEDEAGDRGRDVRLGRTYPQLGSVLSPSRPKSHRPPLGTSLSVPAILSPTKTSPVRGTSPPITATTSPFRRPHSPSVGPLSGNGLAALLGGGGGAGVMMADGNGPTRTYASGRRTVRAPVESEEVGEQATTSTTTTTTTTSKLLAAVPGSSHTQGGDASAPTASSSMGAAPPRRETYASLRLLWGIDAEENLDADEDQDSQDRGAKVVGSGTLRKQGEGKRWMDELGWMCDGLRAGGGGRGEGGDRGAARASAIELVGKALEKDWVRRLKSSGQAETVYLALRTATSSGGGSNAPPRTATMMTADRVLDVAIAVTLALFVKDQRLVEPLLRISPADVQRNAAARKTTPPSSPDDPQNEQDSNSDLLEVLTALLDREWASDEIGTSAAAAGPTQAGGTSGRNRASKVLKSDTRHLQALRDLIDKSSLFSPDDAGALPVSIRSLVLLTIRSIAFFAPRPIFQPQSMLCNSGVLEHIVRDFLNECAGLQARISKYEEGLDLIAPPPAQPQVSIPILSLDLSIFEATSLAGPLAFELISSSELLPPLSLAFTQLAHVAVLLALDRNPGPPPPTTMSRVPIASEDALRTLVAVLGILLALSSNERWSVAFVEAELLPTLVRAALLSRRVAGEGVPVGAPQAAAEKASQSSLSDGVNAAASDATTTTGSEAEDVTAASPGGAATDNDHGRSRLIWDVLSLSVGVLANVLDAAPKSQVGDSLLELSVNPACRGRRKCVRACRCPNDEQETALAALCRLAIDPLDDAVDPVYRASVHGFLRLALGLSLLSSEAAESAITDALEAHPAVLGHVLDALEGFASLYDEREQARRSLRLALPPAGRLAQDSTGASGSHGERDLDDDEEEEEPTQVDLDETQLAGQQEEGDGERVEAGDADSERIIRMREVVQRLRRRVR